MKITAKQFASSLYESVQKKSTVQVKAVVKKFVELLAKNNRLAMADKIIKEFVKIWHEKHGLVEAEITSVSDLSREMIKLLKSYVAKLSGAKDIIVKMKVDKSLLGGVVIKYGDKVLDGSLRSSLSELKNKMIK